MIAINPICEQYSTDSIKQTMLNCKELPGYRALAVFSNWKEALLSFKSLPTEELLNVKVKQTYNQEIFLTYKNKSWIKFIVNREGILGFRVNTLLVSNTISERIVNEIYRPMQKSYIWGN